MKKVKKSLISMAVVIFMLFLKTSNVFADFYGPILGPETPSYEPVKPEPTEFEKILPILLIVGAIIATIFVVAGIVILAIQKSNKPKVANQNPVVTYGQNPNQK